MGGRVTGAVFVHGPRRPGWVYLGTGPKPGHPRDAEGRMILVHEYGPPTSTRIAPAAPIEEATIAPAKIGRGVVATAVQGDLL